MKCISKIAVGEDVNLVFDAVEPLRGSTVITVSEELGEYFIVNAVYDVSFTMP